MTPLLPPPPGGCDVLDEEATKWSAYFWLWNKPYHFNSRHRQKHADAGAAGQVGLTRTWRCGIERDCLCLNSYVPDLPRHGTRGFTHHATGDEIFLPYEPQGSGPVAAT